MNRRQFLQLSAAVILAAPALAASQPPNTKRPNIIIIMADDMGFSDLGCYGGEVHTPNVDRLANHGQRFTQFYNCARCCPTRASLMTGLYPHQAGVGAMTFDRHKPGYEGHLNDNCVTIAEVLRAAGYRTAMAGKWHLSLTREGEDHMRHLNNQDIQGTFSDLASYPVNQGFEKHYGVIWGVVNYFDPYSLVDGTEPVREVPDDYYITDAINDHAVGYIDQFSNGDEPFFLYVAQTAPHWPLHALEEDIARYEDTFKCGWDAIRNARYKRMTEMGLLDPDDAVLTPRVDMEKKWDAIRNQAFEARAMAVHAAMIDRMDRGIGRILDKLEETGELDNTLIFFLSDNGASPENTAIYRSGFDRPSETRDGEPIVYDRATPPGPESTFASIAHMWANAANTPFRYWKAEVFEGGICTPLIVHWPAGLTVDGGSITRAPGHVIDIMATCCDVAGAAYPEFYAEQPIVPLEGQPLTPLFRGDTRPGHDQIGWEHLGARAIRQGDWKLVALAKKPWELYNLADDRTEMHDLAEQEPERVKAMEKDWEAWARRTHVLPRP